ncbi:MAG: amino acid adenylation domain-containing protein, partial [Cyclobacteriaceae bacterium]
RYTSQSDILIGTDVSGRQIKGTEIEENQIGLFENSLALRNEINPDKTYRSIFKSHLGNIDLAFRHQVYPFDRLVEELTLRRDTSRNAVFDILLSIADKTDQADLELTEEAMSQVNEIAGITSARYDVHVLFNEYNQYLGIELIYNTDVYSAEFINRLLGHFKLLLNNLIANPDNPVTQIDYLSAEEKELLSSFNDTASAYPLDKTVTELFEEQVKATPDHVAVVFGDTSLTYQQLDEKANQLAHYLVEKYHIQPEDLLGIKQDRGIGMVVSILGVLKSGGAYVPIDPDYPQARIDFIRNDINGKVCLDEDEFNKFLAEESLYGTEPVRVNTHTSDLAYVIYTSGSTGQPQGVMIEHQSLVNLCGWHQEYYELTPSSRATLFSGVGFDASVWELFPYLTSGGAVYPVTNEYRADPEGLLQFFNENEITHCYMPTILYKDFVAVSDELTHEIKLYVGGQALLTSEKTDKIKLYNNYGPTENTVVTTAVEVEDNHSGLIPIGHPIANTSVYILNEANNLQPKGVVGEICISGTGLARGYLNREALTAEKFIDNPFREGEKLYKTGDLGRWLPDGTIEFQGRIDDQVKVRGYRIELGEIEHVLSAYEALDNVVVTTTANTEGDQELVAYLTAFEEQNVNDLRAYLKELLPDYMIPSYFVQLEEFPLTANGKVDKKQLPAPEGMGLISGSEYIAPSTEMEELLVNIWIDILKQEKIGMNDDFFALGGHSLKAVKLSNEYQKAFSVKITVQDLFAHTTAASHVELIASLSPESFAQIDLVDEQESYAISDSQRRLWVLGQFEGGSIAYNLPTRITLTGEYN